LVPVVLVFIFLFTTRSYFYTRFGDPWSYDENSGENVRQHIQYGKMISLAYDITEKDPRSKNAMENFLGCKRIMEPFVECFFEAYDYKHELRAFPRPILGYPVDTFFGYWAYNNQTGDVAIVLRGTLFQIDWGSNFRINGDIWNYKKESTHGNCCLHGYIDYLHSILLPFWANSKDVILHYGFHDIYTNKVLNNNTVKSLQDEIREIVQNISSSEWKGEIKTITVTGHSLGASIAAIVALDIAEEVAKLKDKRSSKDFNPLIRLINFANPLVGNYMLWKRLKELEVTYVHYFNTGDSVPWFLYGFTNYVHGPADSQRRMTPAYNDLKPELSSCYAVQLD